MRFRIFGQWVRCLRLASTLFGRTYFFSPVCGYAPYPFIQFTIPDCEQNEILKNILYRSGTQRVFLHPTPLYISAAHTAEDIQNTLEIFQKGFVAVENYLNEKNLKLPTGQS